MLLILGIKSKKKNKKQKKNKLKNKLLKDLSSNNIKTVFILNPITVIPFIHHEIIYAVFLKSNQIKYFNY